MIFRIPISILFLLVYFSCNLKRLSKEEGKSFLEKNKIELDSVVNVYLKQSQIKVIIRNKSTLNYRIICFNENVFEISLQEGDNFWDQRFVYQSGNTKTSISTNEFIEQNNIDQSDFKRTIEFIQKYKIFEISKSDEDIFVKINIERFEGLVYVKENVGIHGKIESRIDLEKLSSNWFFFIERY